jgi:hypothetical protein
VSSLSSEGIKRRALIIEDYNAHMGFVDKSGMMVNSYGIAQRSWKWTEKLFFPPSTHDYSQYLFIAQVMWWKK